MYAEDCRGGWCVFHMDFVKRVDAEHFGVCGQFYVRAEGFGEASRVY